MLPFPQCPEDDVSTIIDHLAIAAGTIEDGVAWARKTLGVEVPKGGAHPQMGTHNHLLRLGTGLYLEIIAIDPDAPAPHRPRWFALDDPALRRALDIGPRLIAWIARTPDIRATAARSPVPLGPVEPMRRGALEWLITIPADGSPPEGGAMPILIQWPEDRPHPTEGMPDLGCRLLGLDIGHPEPERLDAALDAIGLDRSGGPVAVRRGTGAPSLTARLSTPAGVVTLGSGGD